MAAAGLLPGPEFTYDLDVERRPRRRRHRDVPRDASGATASSSPARSRPWPARSACPPGWRSASRRASSTPTATATSSRARQARPRLARGVPRPGSGWVPFEPTPGRGCPGAEDYTGVPRARPAPARPNHHDHGVRTSAPLPSGSTGRHLPVGDDSTTSGCRRHRRRRPTGPAGWAPGGSGPPRRRAGGRRSGSVRPRLVARRAVAAAWRRRRGDGPPADRVRRARGGRGEHRGRRPTAATGSCSVRRDPSASTLGRGRASDLAARPSIHAAPTGRPRVGRDLVGAGRRPVDRPDEARAGSRAEVHRRVKLQLPTPGARSSAPLIDPRPLLGLARPARAQAVSGRLPAGVSPRRGGTGRASA